MPTLHIRLLGHFQLIYDDRPVTTINGARLQALLAYLIMNRHRAHDRRQLALVFWPGREPELARSNLRNKLDAVRKKFPNIEHFLDAEDSLQWRTDTAFTLDVANFEQAFQRAEAAKRQRDDTILHAALKEAVDAYGGELLPKLHDDWVLVARQRLHNQFFDVLQELIALLKKQHKYADAIVYAQRLLHDHLHSEAAYRQLMDLYLLYGEPTSALRVYNTCKEMLQRELNITPSPATEAIRQRIDTVSEYAAYGAPLSGMTVQALSNSNAQELRRLAEAWLDENRDLQPFTGVTYFLVRLATLLAAQGESTLALRMLDRTFIMLTATSETTWEAELHLLRGKLLWQQGKPLAEIEECFHKAIAIARHQNAKFLELCAIADLCLLWQHEARQTTARQQLTALYASFRNNCTAEELQAVVLLFAKSI